MRQNRENPEGRPANGDGTKSRIVNGQRIGSVRVSSLEQNLDRQLEGIPSSRVFTDKASGKDMKRPEMARFSTSCAEAAPCRPQP